MRSQRALPWLTILGVLALGAGTADARNACVDTARQDFRTCRLDCREAKQLAKDECLRRDHACVEVCRAERSGCLDDTGLEDALLLCRDDAEAGRADCRATTPPDSPERDQCVDQVQLAAFVCRDDARELGRPLVRACRTDFRGCARSCGPPDPADPPVDVAQCRTDAKDGFVSCQTTCREDFRLEKDGCRNRDHECVEQCRADRYACEAPTLSALTAARDACRAARDLAVADCRAQHPADSPELDACIDAAQVAAFICRDNARELARPALAQCRTDFRGCVQACPAPAP